MNTTGKWTTVAATIGGLLGAIIPTLLKANQIDIADHWALTIGGAAAAIAAGAFAFSAKVHRNP